MQRWTVEKSAFTVHLSAQCAHAQMRVMEDPMAGKIHALVEREMRGEGDVAHPDCTTWRAEKIPRV